jgi:hypothetical protein
MPLRSFPASWPGSRQSRRFFPPPCALLFAALTLTLACGGSGGTGNNNPPPPQAPSITTQPANQSIHIGQSATFTVTASGTAPLGYQWTENGKAITGATSSSYTTAPAVATDNGAVFAVTVSNSAGSVNSSAASLTVGPRAPKTGDLRFQQVDAPSTASGYAAGGLHTNLSGGLAWSFTNAIGTPVTIGENCGPGVGNPYGCTWFFTQFGLPTGVTGLSLGYESFASNTSDNSFPDAALDALANGHNVFFSLDLQLANYTFAASWIQSNTAGGFSYSQQSVDPSQLQAVATQLGQQSSVITAISYDASGNAYFIAYGWTGDTTVYEVLVATATFDNLNTQATNLANAGYIITAVGGNPTNGFLLIGTRVQGDTMARPIVVLNSNTATSSQWQQLFDDGYSIVGYTENPDYSNTYIGEQ